MTWQEALEQAVRETKNERFRTLCADDHPDHEYWRADMLKRAGLPSRAEQAYSVVAAAGHAVSAVIRQQPVFATKEVQLERLNICGPCPERRDQRCGLCNCFLVAKTALAGEQCPIQKWLAVENANVQESHI